MKMKKYFSGIKHQVPVILFLWHCMNLLTSGHYSAASSVKRLGTNSSLKLTQSVSRVSVNLLLVI